MENESTVKENRLTPRRNIRYPLDGDVTYFTEFSSDPMRLKNISADGLCCVCTRIFDPSEEFMVVFAESIFGELTYLRVRVAWSRRGDYREHEFGARFLTETVDISRILLPGAQRAAVSSPATFEKKQELPAAVPTIEKSAETKTARVRPATKILIGAGLALCLILQGLFFAAEKTGRLNTVQFFQKTIKLSGIYYGSSGDSIAIVNGRILKEGDFVTQDIKMDKIFKHSVLFLIRGKAVVIKVGNP